eukprot:scaffold140938_cov71-Attheya_sp.AAC.1
MSWSKLGISGFGGSAGSAGLVLIELSCPFLLSDGGDSGASLQAGEMDTSHNPNNLETLPLQMPTRKNQESGWCPAN